MRSMEQRPGRSLIGPVRLDADETVLHQVGAAHAVFARQAVQRLEDLNRPDLLAVDRCRNARFEVSIAFEAGVPAAVNGKKIGPIQILETLNRLAGENGVGRTDLVENRFVGIKSHGAYETPAGTLLHAAHHELEALALDRDTWHFKQGVALRYAELVYFGQWFTPLRE